MGERTGNLAEEAKNGNVKARRNLVVKSVLHTMYVDCLFYLMPPYDF